MFIQCTKSCCLLLSGIHQWFLLVLLWEGCHRWGRPEELLQSAGGGQAGLQLFNRVHTGKTMSQKNGTLLSSELYGSVLRLFVWLFSGSVRWEPAESRSQQAVGCCGGILACFCQHADEAVSGWSLCLQRRWCRDNFGSLVQGFSLRFLLFLSSNPAWTYTILTA